MGRNTESQERGMGMGKKRVWDAFSGLYTVRTIALSYLILSYLILSQNLDSDFTFDLVALLPSLLMFSCPGCGGQFGTSRAVSNHRRACQAFKNASTSVFETRDRDWNIVRDVEVRRRILAQAIEEDSARRELEIAQEALAGVSSSQIIGI